MENEIKLLIQILKKKKRSDLAKLLVGCRTEVDESSQFGSYLFSTISQYLVYMPFENYYQAKELSADDTQILLDSVLEIYPYQAQAPEIRSIGFRLLKEVSEDTGIVTVAINTDHEFVQEQYQKCIEKLEREDYDGAISSSHSLLEGVFADIYQKTTELEIPKTGDLRLDYKKIKDLLNLSDEHNSEESVKAILRGLTSIVSGIDSAGNEMGDRHRRVFKPEKRHAKVCVNAAHVISEFLYEIMQYQNSRKGEMYKELIADLGGDKRFLSREELLLDSGLNKILLKYDPFLKKVVKDKLIEEYEINHYRESDIFFAGMSIFLDILTEGDLEKIYQKHKENDQACGLKWFFQLVIRDKPGLIRNTEILERYKQNEEAITALQF